MSVADIFTSEEFAGLHWSIPRDTPPAERERAHRSAAIAAKAKRDKDELRQLATNYAKRERLLGWPNGSIVWTSGLEIAANRIEIKP